MNLMFIEVLDAKSGLTRAVKESPFGKVFPETNTWNCILHKIGDKEFFLHNTPLPIGTFSMWTERLQRGWIVGVIDEDNIHHMANFGDFKLKVEAWKERGGIERRVAHFV